MTKTISLSALRYALRLHVRTSMLLRQMNRALVSAWGML